jgi:serine/threonine protein kinase
VYEAGQSAGVLYYTTRLPAGGFLADKVRAPLPSPEEAARLVEPVALAVHELHARRILHRNLTPYSVGLGDDAAPFVLDYTLAMVEWTRPDYLESQGQVVGDAAYAAPEQVFGRRGEIGPATDVYSLGAILYELLTGRPPFEGGGPALIGKVDKEEPLRPRGVRGEVPEDLEAICLRCLSKRPADRYASAEEFAHALRAVLKLAPVPPQRPSSWLARLAGWFRRRSP